MARERKRATIAERIEKLTQLKLAAERSAATSQQRAERLGEQIDRLRGEAREAIEALS